jgi:hypothetical protein
MFEWEWRRCHGWPRGPGPKADPATTRRHSHPSDEARDRARCPEAREVNHLLGCRQSGHRPANVGCTNLCNAAPELGVSRSRQTKQVAREGMPWGRTGPRTGGTRGTAEVGEPQPTEVSCGTRPRWRDVPVSHPGGRSAGEPDLVSTTWTSPRGPSATAPGSANSPGRSPASPHRNRSLPSASNTCTRWLRLSAMYTWPAGSTAMPVGPLSRPGSEPGRPQAASRWPRLL